MIVSRPYGCQEPVSEGDWLAAAIGFAERFAFVRFLRAMGRLSPESDRELAAALGVGESWIRKWKTRADAPEGRSEQKAIEKALEPMGVGIEWLYDGVGAAPDFWEPWYRAHLELQKRPRQRGESADAAEAERPLPEALSQLQPTERRPASELIENPAAKKGGKGKRAG